MRLLDKTLRVYVWYSIAVLVISAPAFYLFTDHLVAYEATEVLTLHKDEFTRRILPSLNESDIPGWNRASRDTRVESQPLVTRDSTFRTFYLDSMHQEEVPFQMLLSPIRVEGKRYTLLLRVSLIESDALIFNIVRVFLVVLILLLTGFYLITRWMSRNIWQPFHSTVGQLEEFELDKNRIPDFTPTSIEEFDRLNTSVNQLLKRNLETFRLQKEFIENAAHELQTPLASLQAKLDVLVQEITLTPALSASLSSLQDSVGRINRIHKNLLLLSRLENDQYAASDNVAVDSVLRRQAEFINEQASERGVTVSVSPLTPLNVNSSVTLVEMAIGNLLVNALRHNAPSGTIQIELRNQVLSISNSGDRALNQDHLFERFHSNVSHGGSGLGLAIVKKICDLHGWQPEYSFGQGLHTFRILF